MVATPSPKPPRLRVQDLPSATKIDRTLAAAKANALRFHADHPNPPLTALERAFWVAQKRDAQLPFVSQGAFTP